MAGQKSNIQKTLVVDLDGTLIKTDILYESLIAYIQANYLNIFRLLPKLIEGKATLKLEFYVRPYILPIYPSCSLNRLYLFKKDINNH